MPSTNPSIFVRLSRAMYERVVELAAADGRSLSNFVEHNLKRFVGPDLQPARKRVPVKRRASTRKRTPKRK
jgi:hypothetical protein